MNGKLDTAEALLGALFVVVSVLSLLGIALAEAGALTRISLAIAGLLSACARTNGAFTLRCRRS